MLSNIKLPIVSVFKRSRPFQIRLLLFSRSGIWLIRKLFLFLYVLHVLQCFEGGCSYKKTNTSFFVIIFTEFAFVLECIVTNFVPKINAWCSFYSGTAWRRGNTLGQILQCVLKILTMLYSFNANKWQILLHRSH